MQDKNYKFELKQPLMVPIGPIKYKLVEEYTYYWEDEQGVINRITVPEGIETDGATVPRVVWTLSGIRPDGLIRAAALVHDWIYVNDGNPPDGSHTTWTGTKEEFFEFYYPNREIKSLTDNYGSKWVDDNRAWSHRQADKLFAQMMTEAGMKDFRVKIAYVSVRLLGWWV
ncbi:MAG: DUF1353 domain-containing protein [Neptunomonas phycophila]|uniref:DUF1353 domain-containing protein n=1 Tax=Neptunomonas phycophila TaxID=1572645 RepID=UPI003B8D66DD